MPIPTSAVIGPITDQVVVLLIGLPPSTPNPCRAHSRPNNVTITWLYERRPLLQSR